MSSLEDEIHADYKARINRVFAHIDQQLDSDLSLHVLADVACFSPFHFHRIFKLITTETVNEFVTRRRVEQAALELLHRSNSVGEIAHKFGFKDNAAFTRTFTKFYGNSPSNFRKGNPNRFSKIRQIESKIGQTSPSDSQYICVINELQKWIMMNAKIEIKEMPQMDVAYASSLGIQQIKAAYDQVIRWATPLGLINDQSKMITIYHDSFKVTEANKVRMSASLLLEKPASPTGEIMLTSIEAGKCLVGHYEITLDEFEKSWTALFHWMHENGYRKADRNPFEIYHNDFNVHPKKLATVDFCIPIQ